MKQLVFVSFLLLFSIKLFAQAMTTEEIENDLNERYEKITSLPYGGGSKWHLLVRYDSLFQEKFAFYTAHYPATLTYPFDSLTKDHKIEVVTSSDKRFRIYSWDNWNGGTMHSTSNLYQFKIGNEVYSKLAVYKSHRDDLNLWYNKIYSLKINNKTYYLGLGKGIYSTKRIGGGIHAFCLESHTLNDTVKLFKTKKGFASALGYAYQIGSLRKVDKNIPPLYDSTTHIIALPLDNYYGKATGKYQYYQFTGKYFEPVKNGLRNKVKPEQ